MTLSKRDQSMLLILLGLIVVLAAYFGIYSNFMGKAEAAVSENDSLQPRLQELQDYYSNLPVYQAGIEEISADVEKKILGFPPDVRSEDLISYGNELEKKLGVTVSNMSFSPPELVSQFSVPKDDGGGGTVLVPYAALSTNMSISAEMTYPQMLDFINYIYKKSVHTTLESISVSYNSETGGLTGSAVMTKYFMSDSEYEYKPTDLPNSAQGTNNPFGTVTVKNKTTED